jgi:hypothetical protein
MQKHLEPSDPHPPQALLFKVVALSVPAAAVLAGAFLPLSEFARQALIGVMLVWIMTSAMVGYNFIG